jgi:hypothetical protein
MKRWAEELERREAVRMRQRLACAVWVDDDRHEGVLEQVSARAVLVRMDDAPHPAGEVRLTFSTPDGVDIALRTIPAKERVVAHAHRGLIPPCVVMHVLEPTDAFLRWIEEPAADEPRPEAP